MNPTVTTFFSGSAASAECSAATDIACGRDTERR